MEENEKKERGFKCSGDCLTCRAINDRKVQWQYCAAQFTYNTMQMVISLQETVKSMSGTVEELKAKIAAIQDSEAHVFDPTGTSEIPTNLTIAQKG